MGLDPFPAPPSEYDERSRHPMKKIYSSPSLFGGMNYYDESGHQIGYSTESLFGGRNFYDEGGHHVGYSTESLFGGENFYSDQDGYKGYSTEGIFGGHHYFRPTVFDRVDFVEDVLLPHFG
jgi:hypothetical protein